MIEESIASVHHPRSVHQLQDSLLALAHIFMGRTRILIMGRILVGFVEDEVDWLRAEMSTMNSMFSLFLDLDRDVCST